MTDRAAEVVVVGAGFAGLAAAQVLGRAQREVLLLGAGPARNAEAAHAHNLLTRDGTPPGEFLALARAEVQALPSVTMQEAQVVAIESLDGDRLRVRTVADGDVQTEAVLVATGARDILPEVTGLAALWGRRAHSCPFCDGEAYAGRRLVVLGEEAPGAHMRVVLAAWTDRVAVVDPSDVAVIEERGSDLEVHLHDGSAVTADGLFVGVTPVPRLDCVAALPLARRGEYLAVDGNGRTTRRGLWAAGDCSWRTGDPAPGGQVVAAMAGGLRAAASIVFDIVGVEQPEPPPIEPPRHAAE